MSELVARAEMLIRRPGREAFDAFVNPDTITKFWLKATTGPLAPDAVEDWAFMVPGAAETVRVTAFEPDRQISFVWSDGIHVNLTFFHHGGVESRVTVEARGFADLAATVGATEGFTIVLCDLKTLLETGQSANLVRDKAALIAGAK
ncbi:MAG: SRPBCC domain-containing protein [Kofleriaceae bacterium]